MPDADPEPQQAPESPPTVATNDSAAQPQCPPEQTQRSADERDVGWGDRPSDLERDDDWYRRERPPHHE